MRITRRKAVGSGMAAALAAARAMAPAIFTGCSLGIPPKAKTVTVGLLHSQTGPLAISATSLRDVQIHAFEQINAAGGILGCQMELKVPDPRSRNDLFPKRAASLIETGAVAVFGCWTSASRKAVLPVFEQANKLLLYAVQYEGNESSKNVVYGNSVPNQQIFPTIDWLLSDEGGARKRIYLIGSDYVFPRTANYVAKKYLAAKGLEPAGEAYYPLDQRDFAEAVRAIADSEADCVLNTINGDSNIGFFEALAAERLSASRLPVISTSIAEDELRGMLPEHVKGHFAASSYFQSLDTKANRQWVEGFQEEFGHDRVTGDAMESGWGLVHLWKTAVEKAGSFDTDAVRQAFRDRIAFDGPGGRMELDPKTQHCSRYFRVGRARDDRQFDIVHASEAPIEADPYPEIAFPGWNCDWTKGGVTRGEEIDIDGPI